MNRHVAARQRAEINDLAFDTVAQEGLGNLRGRSNQSPAWVLNHLRSFGLDCIARSPTSRLGKALPQEFSKTLKSSPCVQGRLVRFELNKHEVFANEWPVQRGRSDSNVVVL